MKTIFFASLPLTLLVAEVQTTDTKLNLNALISQFEEKENTLKRHINLSGKQRMLTQRMTKLAIQIDKNIHKQNSMTTLEHISKLYNTTLKGFKYGDKTLGLDKATHNTIINKITEIEKTWQPFSTHIQAILENKHTKESLDYIVAHNENLLKLSDQLVQGYESINTSKDYLEKIHLHIINIAGRQRMLTQKMSKEKLLTLGEDTTYASKLKETIVLFDTSLHHLIEGNKTQNILAPSNTKIITQLNTVLTLWKELKPLYVTTNVSMKDLATLIIKNPILLQEMDAMVHLAETELEY